jgi:hypothetical protein
MQGGSEFGAVAKIIWNLARRRQLNLFVVVFPSEIRPILGRKVGYGAKKRESGLSAVSLRTCGPLALIPVNGKKLNRGAKIRAGKWLQRTRLGSPGDDTSK